MVIQQEVYTLQVQSTQVHVILFALKRNLVTWGMQKSHNTGMLRWWHLNQFCHQTKQLWSVHSSKASSMQVIGRRSVGNKQPQLPGDQTHLAKHHLQGCKNKTEEENVKIKQTRQHFSTDVFLSPAHSAPHSVGTDSWISCLSEETDSWAATQQSTLLTWFFFSGNSKLSAWFHLQGRSVQASRCYQMLSPLSPRSVLTGFIYLFSSLEQAHLLSQSWHSQWQIAPRVSSATGKAPYLAGQLLEMNGARVPRAELKMERLPDETNR